MRTDFNKAGVCLTGAILRDSMECSDEMKAGSNITFIMRLPSSKLIYNTVDAARESIDRVHKFKICPSRSFEEFEAGISESSFSKHDI